MNYHDSTMLKLFNLAFGTITIILFSVNLSLLVYAQYNQYYYNTNKDNSSLLNELKIIKKILETKVTKLATSLQIAVAYHKFYNLQI